jgi:hypothetical protein
MAQPMATFPDFARARRVLNLCTFRAAELAAPSSRVRDRAVREDPPGCEDPGSRNRRLWGNSHVAVEQVLVSQAVALAISASLIPGLPKPRGKLLAESLMMAHNEAGEP